MSYALVVRAEDAAAAKLGFFDDLPEEKRTVAEELHETALSLLKGASRAVLTGRQPPSELLDNFLYVGSRTDAGDDEWLRSVGVTHVLNMAGSVARGSTEGRTVLELESEDDARYPILQHHWSAARAFLARARNTPEARVLVHCSAGINRSCCVAVAFMMHDEGLSLLDAIERARQRRSKLLLNAGFVAQLVRLHLAVLKDTGEGAPAAEDEKRDD